MFIYGKSATNGIAVMSYLAGIAPRRACSAEIAQARFISRMLTAKLLTQPKACFDTPSLIETWRSGPYLHDGRAVTVKEVITTFNPADRHGSTSHLSAREIEDLAEFVLSL
jgi:hypothetical protein